MTTYRILGRDDGIPSLHDSVLNGIAVGATADLTLAADVEAELIAAGLIEVVGLSATTGTGTLAARPPASAASGRLYLASDDNGGTLYRSDGSTWTKAATGVTEAARGQLGSTVNRTSIGSTAVASNNAIDVTGLDVSFTYRGRPVMGIVHLPGLKYSVVNVQASLRIVDKTTAEPTNTKGVAVAHIWTPSTANAQFTMGIVTPPVAALWDGTPLVSGTTYTWKLSFGIGASGAGNFSTAWAQEFFGHHSIIEA